MYTAGSHMCTMVEAKKGGLPFSKTIPMKIFSTAKLWGDKYMFQPYSLLTIEFSGSWPSQMESSLTYCLAPGNLPEHIFSHPLTCSTWNLSPQPGQQPRWIPVMLCLCARSLVGLECHPVLFHHAEWISIFKSHSMSSVKLVLILPGRVSSDSLWVSTAICICQRRSTTEWHAPHTPSCANEQM